ncbi:MAG: polyribonucleotide nucleotidyltransferase [Sedimentisphaerales bacterium]|nr:polyribonucleotide nucleotidyltransferase [Sedimentisphaerales bacterium]
MFEVKRVEKKIGAETIILETGKISRQAHGSVTVQYGETIVLATAVCAPPRFDDADFFPLSVDYREKYSAAGKFPGGFIKREGRPSTKEVLTARMIDRPIRPLFPDGYFDEVQVLINVLSFDQKNDPDVLAMVAASAALTISKIPFEGPIGACRVGRVEGQFIINPTYEQRTKSDLNLTLTGVDGQLNMIEVDAGEVPEEVVSAGVAEGLKVIQDICSLILELRSMTGIEKEIPEIEQDQGGQLEAALEAKLASAFKEAYRIPQKAQRMTAIKEIRTAIAEQYFPADATEEPPYSVGLFNRVLGNLEKKVFRRMILEEGRRADGRSLTELRSICCEVGLLPRSHGSALFTRGETQALVSATLGTGRDEQTVDGLLEEYGQKFMLHYNFPPSSVGEVRPIRGPGRREIGHGALAEKALQQVFPSEDVFPYTVKLVSDITESNGSSSMASVCGGCLALMDAGVPIAKPVAGISIGLISDENRHVLLTDILGDEDHFGDMDFKVAGTENGITAIQLDLKRRNLPFALLQETLLRARNARLQILQIMKQTIAEPRAEISIYAPKIISIKIDPEYIGKVIGPGGAMVRGIQEQTGSVIEIEEDGTINISCVGGDGHLKAKSIIEAMTTPPEVGRVYESAKVVAIKEFGAFVEISPGIEGLCHISELSDGYVRTVEDVCKVGDVVPVKLILIDEQGRFKLSRKAAMAELGLKDDLPERPDQGRRGDREERSNRGDRGNPPRDKNR